MARRELAFQGPPATPKKKCPEAAAKSLKALDRDKLIKLVERKTGGVFTGDGSKEVNERKFSSLLRVIRLSMRLMLVDLTESVDAIMDLSDCGDVISGEPVAHFQELNDLLFFVLFAVVSDEVFEMVDLPTEKQCDGKRAMIVFANRYQLMQDTDVRVVQKRMSRVKIDGSKDPTVQLKQISTMGDTVARLTETVYVDVFRKNDYLNAIDGCEFFAGLIDILSGEKYTSERLSRDIVAYWENHAQYAAKKSPYAAASTLAVGQYDEEYAAAARLVYSRGDAEYAAAAAAFAPRPPAGVCYSCGKPGHYSRACPGKETPKESAGVLPVCDVCADGSKHTYKTCPAILQLKQDRKSGGGGKGGVPKALALCDVSEEAEIAVPVRAAPASYSAAARVKPEPEVIKKVLGRRDFEIACASKKVRARSRGCVVPSSVHVSTFTWTAVVACFVTLLLTIAVLGVVYPLVSVCVSHVGTVLTGFPGVAACAEVAFPVSTETPALEFIVDSGCAQVLTSHREWIEGLEESARTIGFEAAGASQHYSQDAGFVTIGLSDTEGWERGWQRKRGLSSSFYALNASYPWVVSACVTWGGLCGTRIPEHDAAGGLFDWEPFSDGGLRTDWASDTDGRESYTSILVLLYGDPGAWLSRRQAISPGSCGIGHVAAVGGGRLKLEAGGLGGWRLEAWKLEAVSRRLEAAEGDLHVCNIENGVLGVDLPMDSAMSIWTTSVHVEPALKRFVTELLDYGSGMLDLE